MGFVCMQCKYTLLIPCVSCPPDIDSFQCPATYGTPFLLECHCNRCKLLLVRLPYKLQLITVTAAASALSTLMVNQYNGPYTFLCCGYMLQVTGLICNEDARRHQQISDNDMADSVRIYKFACIIHHIHIRVDNC